MTQRLITTLAICLFIVTSCFSQSYSYYFNKGLDLFESDCQDAAFSTWSLGAVNNENRSRLATIYCLLNEWGTPFNRDKSDAMIDEYAKEGNEWTAFAANYWFPVIQLNWKYQGDLVMAPGCRSLMQRLASWCYYNSVFSNHTPQSVRFGGKPDIAKSLKYAKKYLAKYPYNPLCNHIVSYCYLNGQAGLPVDTLSAIKHAIHEYLNDEDDRQEMLILEYIENCDKDEIIKRVNAVIPLYEKEDYYPDLTTDSATIIETLNKKYDSQRSRAVQDILRKYYYARFAQTDYIRADCLLDSIYTISFDDFLNRYNKENIIAREYISKTIKQQIDSIYEQFRKCDDPQELKKNLRLFYLGWEKINIYEPWREWRDCATSYIDRIDDIALKIEELDYLEAEYNVSLSDLRGKLHKSAAEHFSGIINDSNYCVLVKLEEKKQPIRYHYISWNWQSSKYATANTDNNAMLYGTPAYELGRKNILSHKENVAKIYADATTYENTSTKDDIYRRVPGGIKKDKHHNEFLFSIPQLIANADEIKSFIIILEKENDGSITITDYEAYLNKFPSAYYSQYCIDAIARLTADSYTIDTPKEEIKALLKSGLSPGTIKYIKQVTKKSYLKAKQAE